MAEIVNLRNARKAKRRAEDAEQAAENRVRHGRTLAERDQERLQAERSRRALDGAEIEP